MDPTRTVSTFGYPKPCVFSGVNIRVTGESEYDLGGGFTLIKPNTYVLSARSAHSMTGFEFSDAGSISRYLLFKQEQTFPPVSYEAIKNTFFSGLFALQLIRPFPTLGIVFSGQYYEGDSPTFHLQNLERRSPINPGEWVRGKKFDEAMLKSSSQTIPAVRRIMEGSVAEQKNAFNLFQLGLETFHPMIACLLWVTGLEAIFDSHSKHDFKRSLCQLLGTQTPVFPDWVDSRPAIVTEDIAIPLYVLRSKIAHGVDLRSAASDRRNPVDLLADVQLPGEEQRGPHALLLAMAAFCLLWQVLRKQIRI